MFMYCKYILYVMYGKFTGVHCSVYSVLIMHTSTNAAYKITVRHRSISDHFAEMNAQIVAWLVLPSSYIFSLCNQASPAPRPGPLEASKSHTKLSWIEVDKKLPVPFHLLLLFIVVKFNLLRLSSNDR